EEVARKAQPPHQRGRRGREGCQLPASEAEPVAQRHRAKVGSRQAQGRRAGGAARSIRACRQGVRSIRLYSSRAAHCSTGGGLIMHEASPTTIAIEAASCKYAPRFRHLRLHTSMEKGV